MESVDFSASYLRMPGRYFTCMSGVQMINNMAILIEGTQVYMIFIITFYYYFYYY